MITTNCINQFKQQLSRIQPVDTIDSQTRFASPRRGFWWKPPTGNLFWFQNAKSASSLYMELLTKLGWQRCHFMDIKGDDNYFFGHIRDPLTKHRKGITEVFFYREEFSVLRKRYNLIMMEDWMTVISNLHSFDQHCMSIENLIGEKAKEVYWIPIDTELDHKTHTLELLDFFGQNVPSEIADWFLKSSRINPSTEAEEIFYQQLAKIQPSIWLIDFLDFDQCLYDTAVYFHKESLVTQGR